MQYTIPYGQRSYTVHLDASRADVILARSKNPPVSSTWESVVAEALAQPIDVPPISAEGLRGKKVVILTDDWDRPTPAYLVIPLLLKELSATGIADEDITFITASGMHDPLSREGLERKLGADVVARYRCLAHDGGDWDNLAFLGHSSLGTPVWVNRYVAGADYRIGLGRVYLHGCYGYEGGYKLILPGVSGFDTILRDHGMNFSATSLAGIHENPSRTEADNVGRMVGLDFLINVVVNGKEEPFRAFAGAVEPAHQRAIAYGDREIWGAEVGDPADVTLASHGAGAPPPAGYDTETVRRACSVTRPDGTVIVLADQPVPPLPDWRAGEPADDVMLDRLPRAEFGPQLRPLAYSEIVRLHERRDWPLPLREIQWRVKALRGEFYRRRWLMAAETRQVVLTGDPQVALDRALAAQTGRPRLLLLPSGKTTMPKPCLYTAS